MTTMQAMRELSTDTILSTKQVHDIVGRGPGATGGTPAQESRPMAKVSNG